MVPKKRYIESLLYCFLELASLDFKNKINCRFEFFYYNYSSHYFYCLIFNLLSFLIIIIIFFVVLHKHFFLSIARQWTRVHAGSSGHHWFQNHLGSLFSYFPPKKCESRYIFMVYTFGYPKCIVRFLRIAARTNNEC